MYELKQEFSCLTEVKQSKFFSFALPQASLDQRLAELKTKHPKARHFIVAWRQINEHKQTVEYSTDDGEPKGTSGRPVLNVLRGQELVNTAVIVVRYFGGTKLGTGGLVRAYTDAAKEVLAQSVLENFELKESVDFYVTYSDNDKVEHFLQKHSIELLDKEFVVSGVDYHVAVTKEQLQSINDYAKHEQLIRLRED